MKTGTLTPAARWCILLCAIFCLFVILPFGYAQSITELKSKAEDGDVQAQLALAKAYDLGEGVPKDEEKAVQWWEKAAEQHWIEDVRLFSNRQVPHPPHLVL